MTGVSELSKLDKYLSSPAELVGKHIEAIGELATVCQYFELIAGEMPLGAPMTVH